MKKILTMLMALFLLFASCSARPDGLDNTEPETETKTEYVEPPKSYLDELRADRGYYDAPDSIFCYIEPLIAENDYLDAAEIPYDLKEKAETRFLSSNHMYTYERLYKNLAGEDDGTAIGCGNICYLTEADGTRTKLCPYEECREDFYETCLHLIFYPGNGKVYGDYVYFIGSNRCIAAPNHPNRSEETGTVNMLLRYSLENHTLEKVLDLPEKSQIQGAAYGILYIAVYDEAARQNYFILHHPESLTAAKAPAPQRVLYYFEPEGIYTIHIDSDEVRLYTPLLTEYTVADRNPHITLFATFTDDAGNTGIAERKNGGYGMLDRDFTSTVVHISQSGRETMMLQNVFDWCAAEDAVYVIEHGNERTVCDFGEDAQVSLLDMWTDGKISLYTDTVVYRYDRNADGSLDLSSKTAVFTENDNTLEEGEMLLDCQPYGQYVRVVTVLPPLENNVSPRWRRYIVSNTGVTFDGEGITSANYVDEH